MATANFEVMSTSSSSSGSSSSDEQDAAMDCTGTKELNSQNTLAYT